VSGLVLQSVTVSVGARQLVGPLDLSVTPGQVVSILGPSGAGKSSLLAFLCGVLPPPLHAQGTVLLNGDNISNLPPEQRRLGILFQDDLLFPHLSVAGNLAFGLRSASNRRDRGRIISDALAGFGLAGYETRDPATLSGGERSRVALLRVLLSAPRAVLLDEPFSRLDPATRQTIRALTLAQLRARSLPALLVSHDVDDVVAAGGPVVRVGNA